MTAVQASAGQVVAVTGGASGIGAACVRLFAGRGDRVFALDVDESSARALCDASPGVHFVRVDVADAGSVGAAFATIAGAAGRLDVLVNSAGVESRALLSTIADAAWDRVLDVNLKGTMLCTRAAIPLMKPRGGSIVNIASVAGKRMSFSGDVAYTASKGGVLAFTRHAGYELAPDGIRVNAVCPGPTLTPMIERNLSRERMDALARTVPLGRWVRPEDVAQAVAFFAGPGAAMCTGGSLDVDGGVMVSNGGRYEDYFAGRG